MDFFVEYYIVSASSLTELIKEVNERIKQFWYVEVGMSVLSEGNSTRFFQPIRKRRVIIDGVMLEDEFTKKPT